MDVNTLRRFWSKVDTSKPRECWEWQANLTDNGYGAFRMDGRNHRAHRLAWTICNGNIPDGKIIMHTCDNPSCCNPSHLRVGTYSDNTRDMYNKKRNGRKGSRVIASRIQSITDSRKRRDKVTPAQVVLIRRLYSSGARIDVIGKLFGISRAQAWNIGTRRAWKHIENIIQDAA